jgi:hypothetical protein
MRRSIVAGVLFAWLALIGLPACGDTSGGIPSNVDSGAEGGGRPDATGSSDAPASADAAQNVDATTPDSGITDSGGPDGAANEASSCTHGSPPRFHPSDGGPMSLFCGFLSGDAGTLNCDPHLQICCVGGTQEGGAGFVDPVCGVPGTPCSNGNGPREIDCEDPNDCPTPGSTCCIGAIGSTTLPPALDPACNYDYARSGIRTHCVTPDAGGPSCRAGEFVICTGNAQCPADKPTCIPFKSIFFSLGFCM